MRGGILSVIPVKIHSYLASQLIAEVSRELIRSYLQTMPIAQKVQVLEEPNFHLLFEEEKYSGTTYVDGYTVDISYLFSLIGVKFSHQLKLISNLKIPKVWANEYDLFASHQGPHQMRGEREMQAKGSVALILLTCRDFHLWSFATNFGMLFREQWNQTETTYTTS